MHLYSIIIKSYYYNNSPPERALQGWWAGEELVARLGGGRNSPADLWEKANLVLALTVKSCFI